MATRFAIFLPSASLYFTVSLSPTFTSARAFCTSPIIILVLSLTVATVSSALSFIILVTVIVMAFISTAFTLPVTCFTFGFSADFAGSAFFSAGAGAEAGAGAAFFSSVAKEKEAMANTKITATKIAIAFFTQITSFHRGKI